MKYNCIESVKADFQEQSDMLQQLESRKSQLIQFDGCTLKIKNSGGTTYYHCRENPAHPWLYLGRPPGRSFHPRITLLQRSHFSAQKQHCIGGKLVSELPRSRVRLHIERTSKNIRPRKRISAICRI